MIVDIHTHILPPDIPAFKKQFGYGGFIQLEHTSNCCARMVRDDGQFFRTVESNCWDPLARLNDCQQTGVRKQVLSTVPVMFSYWAKPQDGLTVSQYLNDHIAGIVAKHPEQFYALGTVPMQDTELAIGELRRCMQTLGLSGVQIGTHVNSKNLDDPQFFPFFEECEKLGAAVFIHPWDMLAPERMPRFWLPWLVGMPTETTIAICSFIFGGLFERLPKLRVAFAHGGGSFPGTYARIQHGFEARPDLCATHNPHPPTKYLGHFYLDSLVHDKTLLRQLVDLVGANRIALGSDYPFPLGELKPGDMILGMDSLTQVEKDWLLYKTAAEWLGIKISN